MTPRRRIVIILAFLQGTWMVIDSLNVVARGEYIRLYGELGPWKDLLASLGINHLAFWPIFLILGIVWIAGSILLYLGKTYAWELLLICAVLTLFYLIFGTLSAAVVIAFLLIFKAEFQPRREV